MTRKMKDSGVEWIGEIPENWETRRLKNGLRKKKVIINKYDNQPILSLTMNGVSLRDLVNPKGKMPTTFDGYQEITPGNIIECLFDIDVTPRCVGIARDYGLTSPAYTQFEVINDFDTDFIYYYLLMLDNDKILVPISKSLRNTITSDEFLILPFSFPPVEEQRRISNRISTETARINSIISETQQSIDELKKYKQALITEAVTKGLDKNVEMKDSGIDWIGKIPSFWKIGRLKNLINQPLMYGANASGELFNPEWPRYIRITDIQENNSLSSENILSLEPTLAAPYILKKGDLLFARSGATVGKTYYIDETSVGGAFAGYLIKASFNNAFVGEFVYYYTLSYSYQKWKESIAIQATIQNIGADKYSNMPLPIPDIAEMKILVEKVSRIDRRISKIIEEKKKMIKTMLNYKQSLIYEYVTGKKEA